MSLSEALRINIRKTFNKIIATKYPETNGGWYKPVTHPIIGDKNCDYFDPFVLKNNDKYIMYLSSRGNNGIVLFESSDGFDWSFSNDVLVPNKDNVYYNRMSIVKTAEGLWRLYFTYQTRDSSKIYMVESQSYQRFDTSVAICCILHNNMNVNVMNPHVLWDAEFNEYKMWFSAGDMYEPDEIFFATSKSGLEWNVYDIPVLTKNIKEKFRRIKVGGCYVHKNSNGFFDMYYIGYQNVDTAAVCHASSSDGIQWNQDQDNPILSASRRSWDSDSIYKPSYIQEETKSFIWYNGRKRKHEYIGIAQKDNEI